MEFQRFYDGRMRRTGESSETETFVCIICCSSFTGVLNSNEKKSVGTSLKLLFGKLATEVGLDSLETCSECRSLLESYGKIYHQWKLLELQLQWRVKELSNIIQGADKTPNNLETFKTWCDNLDSRDKDKVGGKLVQFRSKLYGKCMKLQAKFPPWVLLERIDNKKSSSVNRLAENHEQNQKALFLGWLSSFVAFAHLSDFNQEEAMKINQLEDFPVDDKLRITSPMSSPVEAAFISRTASHVRKQCAICESFFCSGSSLRRHMGRFHPDLPGATSNKILYKCYKCSSLFPTSDILRKHLRRQHEGSQYKVLLQHVKRDEKHWALDTTTGSERTEKYCGICKIYFYKESTLDWHMKTFHADDKPSVTPNETEDENKILYKFKCYKCGSLFSRGDLLRRHMRRMHRGCPMRIVLRAVKDLGQSETVRRVPSAIIKPNLFWRFDCDYCSKTYGRKKHLNRHLRMVHGGSSTVHEKSGPAYMAGQAECKAGAKFGPCKPSSRVRCQCDNCGRWLSDKSRLRRHKLHNVCNSERQALRNLNATLDFVCQFCDMNLSTRFMLERHVASWHRFNHEKARKFKHLDMTKRDTAGIYFCAFCGLVEDSREAMMKHFRQEHRDMFGIPKKPSPE